MSSRQWKMFVLTSVDLVPIVALATTGLAFLVVLNYLFVLHYFHSTLWVERFHFLTYVCKWRVRWSDVGRTLSILTTCWLIILISIPESIKRVEELTGKEVPAYVTDLLDKEGIRKIFKKVKMNARILIYDKIWKSVQHNYFFINPYLLNFYHILKNRLSF